MDETEQPKCGHSGRCYLAPDHEGPHEDERSRWVKLPWVAPVNRPKCGEVKHTSAAGGYQCNRRRGHGGAHADNRAKKRWTR